LVSAPDATVSGLSDAGVVDVYSDTTPPTVKASGASSGSWHHSPVVLTLSAADNAGGFGLKSITYKLGSAAAVTVTTSSTQLTIPAPADHSDDGLHSLTYYATDLAGNRSATKTLEVGIDTVAPRPVARAPRTKTPPSYRRGATIKIPYVIADHKPGCGKARVTIAFYRIPAHAGKAVYVTKRTLGLKLTNHSYTYAFRCTLTGGNRYYLYMIEATDIAGNVSATSLTYGDPVFNRVCRQLRVS
jgi:hypothetical protein